VRALTEQQVRRSFVNCSRGEAGALTLPPGFGDLDWAELDVLGWRDPRAPLRGSLVLEVDDEPLPHASIWPLAAAVAGLLVGAGLLFGGWFWAPGAALGAVAAWRWLHQLEG